MRASRALAALCCAALVFLAAGCASEFERQFGAAESLRQRAEAKGYEWIGTADLLEQAKALATDGDTAGALALVEQARFQSAAALEQAEREAGTWQGRVLK